MDTKTARDLPPGSEVHGRWGHWTKGQIGYDKPWASDHGACLADEEVDELLAGGATITFVPVGGGRRRMDPADARQGGTR